MIKVAENWKDYEIIATGDGMKLERWGNIVLLRPDPQVIWPSKINMYDYSGLHAYYNRSSKGGGQWVYLKSIPEQFIISRDNLKFFLKLMGFKHTGLFPEQAVNWDIMSSLIKDSNRPIKVLNLFAYTGGATLACVNAGGHVCHVDAAKSMVERAGQNYKLSKLPNDKIRYIIDDCYKFVRREIRRGNKYDAILMDPPSYGRGPSAEVWRIEDNIYDLVNLTTNLLSDNPLFYLINSYTTGLQPAVIRNIIDLNMSNRSGKTQAYEVALPTNEGIVLPCGCSGIRIF